MRRDGGRARTLAVGAVTALSALLLLAGLVLTLARVWQPGSGPFGEPVVTVASLVPLAIPLYALAALGAVVVLLRSRRAGAVLLGLAVAGLVAHLWWFSPFLSADAPAAADGPRLRVLTINALVWTGATGRDLVDLARGTDADVMVVEELEPVTYGEAMDAGLARLYPHRTTPPAAGLSTTAIWSRLPLGDVGPVPGDAGSVRATLDWDGRAVPMIGVHTAPPVWPDRWRGDHAALLADVRRDPPAFLAGDFNATPDHVQLRRLEAAGLRDAGDLTGSGWAPTWPSNGVQRVLGLPVPRFATIDHVMVGSGWTVTSMRRVHVPLTDHTAVLAVLAPERGGTQSQ